MNVNERGPRKRAFFVSGPVLSLLLNIGLCCEYMAARAGFDAGQRCLALNYPASHRSPEIMS
jgi:hypothetical protein